MAEEVVDMAEVNKVAEETEVVVGVVIVVEEGVVKWFREPSSLGGGNLHIFLRVSLLNRRRYMINLNQITERMILMY